LEGNVLVYTWESIKDRVLGPETNKSHKIRHQRGFYDRYMCGNGLDIGFKGQTSGAQPVLPTATGVEKSYPGYDGIILPFLDNSQQYVFASHILEHVAKWEATINEWYRVINIGGYIIICVPHQHLYEKRHLPPSRYNADHKRFYTPGRLLKEIESSLEPNSYRIRKCEDNDNGYDYSIPPDKHSAGCFEVVCVIEKIKKPEWRLK